MPSPDQTELDERYEEALENVGVRSVSVDGTNISVDGAAELTAIEKLEQRRAARTRGVLPIGMTKFISRGLQ